MDRFTREHHVAAPPITADIATSPDEAVASESTSVWEATRLFKTTCEPWGC
jgi:hypothetical protein